LPGVVIAALGVFISRVLARDMATEAVYLLVFSTGLYALLCWHVFRRDALALLDLDSIFLMFFGAYVILPAMLCCLWPDAPFLSDDVILRFTPQTPEEVAFVGRCSLIMLIGLGLGFCYTPRWVTQPIPWFDRPWGMNAELVGGGMLGLGSAMILLLVVMVGLDTYSTSSYGEVYVAEEGFGFLQAGIGFMQIGLFVLLLRSQSSGVAGKRLTWIVWGLFCIFALLELRIGRRRVVLESGTGLLILHHFAVKPIRRMTLALILAGSLFLFGAVGQLRAFMDQGLEGMLTYATNDLTLEDGKGVFFELYVTIFTTNETARLVDQWQGHRRYGASYLEAFEVLIPLSFHPTRPLASSQWFVREFDPALASRGGGYSYSHMAEGYLNLGYFGVLLTGLASGLLVHGMVSLRRARPTSAGRLLFYAVVCIGVVSYIRSDFASTLKTYVISGWVPTLIIAYVLGHLDAQTVIRRRPVTAPLPPRSLGSIPGVRASP
jgi:hypothetical protein